jgi:nitroreductase
MDVWKAIEERRAYRSLDPVEVTEELVRDLANCARLAPSCFNKQPWNYVFVYDEDILKEMHTALSDGNEWCTRSSMIIAVFGKEEDDCVIYDRKYYLFDIGMATAHIILRATELGLVAHPIAGYSPSTVRKVLGIPEEMNVITLVNVGKHADEIYPILTDKQKEAEPERPERKKLGEFALVDKYGNSLEEK